MWHLMLFPLTSKWKFFIVHHRTSLVMCLSLQVFTKTDIAVPWKKQIINIAFFFKLKIYSDVLTMRVMYLEVVCTQS